MNKNISEIQLPMQKVEKRDADYFYSLIDSDIEKTFSYEQKSEIKNVLTRAISVPSKKIIDYRITFWFFQRLYLVIFLGKDIRARGRSSVSSGPLIIKHLITGIVLCIIIFFMMIFLFFALYMIKSYMGIDFFEDSHLSDFIDHIKKLF